MDHFLKPWDRWRVPRIVLLDREGVPHSGMECANIDKAERRSRLQKRLQDSNQ